MYALQQDLRYALRMMAKNPGFTLAAVLTIALGIGLTSAVFSLVNTILLKPLPVAHPEQLVNLYTEQDGGILTHTPMAFPDFEDLRETSQSFSHLIAYSFAPMAFEHDGDSRLALGELVSGNYFAALGVQPILGRAFTAEDDLESDPQLVAVLHHNTWQQKFGGDPQVIGRDLRLNGRLVTVVAVAPPGFNGLTRGLAPELWVPMQTSRTLNSSIASVNLGDATPDTHRLDDRARRWHWAMARLRPGVSLEQARAEIATLGGRLAEAYPETNEERVFALLPASQVRVMPGVDKALHTASWVVMGLVTLVLLIACANLANMLLARNLSRRKEMATRLAFGAARGQLIRQLLIESLTMALAGGTLGLVLAALSNKVLNTVQLPLPVNIVLDLSLDHRVIFFTLSVATLTAVIFGLTPALEATRTDLVTTLRESTRGSEGRRKRRLRDALVVAQVALSLLLLICAGLSLRSMQNAQHIDPGFDPKGVAVAQLAPQLQGYDRPQSEQFYERLAERLMAQPDVEAVGFATHAPLAFDINIEPVAPEGQDNVPREEWPSVDGAAVGPGYFAAMGIDLLAGRGFTVADGVDAPQTVVINQTLAERFWPDESPLGKRLRFAPEDQAREVVGVARNGKYRTLGEDSRPFAYRPLAQSFTPSQLVLVRVDGDAHSILPSIRQIARGLDENIALSGLEPLEKTIAPALLLPRLGATLFGLFGLIGLTLAALGLYGVLAYAVSQRAHEIGIRMAVGAERGDILRMILSQSLWLTATGTVLGLAASLLVTRAIGVLLYGISATDLGTYAGVSLFLIVVGLGASFLPARRAAAVDPLVALRYE